jgi:alpha-beta hydrolase superfamily lysophospholipase
MERFTIASSDGLPLTVRLWQPKIHARGIAQLAHGAGEHLGRYEALASSLNERGFVVVGADHRGHGDNRSLHGRGAFGARGFSALVEDMASVATNARARVRGVPLLLVAHSMGSFAAQVMLARHAELLDGLVLSGTTAIDLLLETAAAE